MSATMPPVPAFRYEVQPDDPGVVRRLVGSSGFFNGDEIDVAVELVQERLTRGAQSGYHFVFAEQGGSVTGYTCYGHIPGTAGSYDLYWIAVDTAERRKGLGRVLLEETERLIRGLCGRRIYIETSNRSQYLPTRGFYERMGYQLDAVLEDFYAPGDDKAIYAKAL